MTTITGAPFSLSSVAHPATLNDLELERALDHVAARAVSGIGADAVRKRRPVHDFDTIVRELARVGELVRHLHEQGQFRPVPVPDIAPELDLPFSTSPLRLVCHLMEGFQAPLVMHAMAKTMPYLCPSID